MYILIKSNLYFRSFASPSTTYDFPVMILKKQLNLFILLKYKK